MNYRKESSKRAGIWIRASTEAEARSGSPATHERLGRTRAASRDWTVVEVYRLHAVPDGLVKDHPETKRMLGDIQSGHVALLIFQALAQLTRDLDDLIDFADQFHDTKTDLVSFGDGIDTTTLTGHVTFTTYMTRLALERE